MKEQCSFKNCNSKEGLQEHHLIPKSIAKDKKNTGIVVTLCKKHHDIIHYSLPSWLFWYFVPKEDYENCRDFIEKKTKELIKNGK